MTETVQVTYKKENLRLHLTDLRKEVSFSEIGEILSSTIKRDEPSKLIAFAGMLLAQTDQDQYDIAFQSESSAGKTYIPLELASYFPKEEIKELASASPTAFFHEVGIWDETRKCYVVDLERKIVIFIDQPHFMLLERLRPLLSHDRKELEYRITDRSEKKGLRTKRVILRGFSTFIFCTGKLNPDDQEKTRLILLSPSVDEDKIKDALKLIAHRNSQRSEYDRSLEEDPERNWLKTRVQIVRAENITDVYVEDPEAIYNRFLSEHKNSKPRDMRDLPRIIALVKAHALLNCFNREHLTKTRIKATVEDIEAGFQLYRQVSQANELGLSPYILNIYNKVIQPLAQTCPEGLDKKAVAQKYLKTFHKPITRRVLDDILEQLENSGLILREPDPTDKRRTLILVPDQKYVPNDCGVKSDTKEEEESQTSLTKDLSYPTVPGYISTQHNYGPDRKAICSACWMNRYERLNAFNRIGILSEGACQECGSPAELLIQLEPDAIDLLVRGG